MEVGDKKVVINFVTDAGFIDFELEDGSVVRVASSNLFGSSILETVRSNIILSRKSVTWYCVGT